MIRSEQQNPMQEPMLDKEQLLTLGRPGMQCAECGAQLEELDRHPTRLRLREEGLQRADFCPDCWEFAKNDTYESYWVTRRIRKEKPKPKLTRREKAVAARALFESLWERRDQEDVEDHLYFLAHLLLRWGGLKWVRNYTDRVGAEVVVFENPSTGDHLEIPSVDTTAEAMEAINQDIENFLMNYVSEPQE